VNSSSFSLASPLCSKRDWSPTHTRQKQGHQQTSDTVENTHTQTHELLFSTPIVYGRSQHGRKVVLLPSGGLPRPPGARWLLRAGRRHGVDSAQLPCYAHGRARLSLARYVIPLYLHTRIHICMCICLYVCIYVCMYVCVCVYMYICVHIYIYICVYVCIYTYIYILKRVLVYYWYVLL